jgi:hypothetical protein
MKTILLTLTILFVSPVFVGCCKKSEPLPIAPRLSATEEFDLRGKCAVLGEQLERDVIADKIFTVGANLVKSDKVIIEVASNYGVKANRCYVSLTISPSDLIPLPPKGSTLWWIHTYLYDGQTHEQLAESEKVAYATEDHSIKDGGFASTPTGYETGYDKASAFIAKTMQREEVAGSQ